jgi:signal transduction histidine kinase
MLEIVNSVGTQWSSHRSAILDLAESEAVLAALREGRSLTETSDSTAILELERDWAKLAAYVSGSVGIANEATVHDRDGEVIGRLSVDREASGPSLQTSGLGGLSHYMPIHDPVTGERLGTLEVRLHTERLLPPGLLVSGIGGSMFALFDGRTGAPLTPIPVEPDLYSRTRFPWAGDDWITVERRLREPPLRLVLAGPLGPVTAPFEQAARRGLFALVIVALAALGLATLLTRHFTRSLMQLSKAADAVSHGDLSRRAEEAGPPEIEGVARAFNAMTESLGRTLERLTQQEAVAAVGEFAASLAHEVRNPLTSVRMDLQLTRHKVGEESDAQALLDHALSEIDRLNESVSGVLRVARSGRASLDRIDLRVPLDAAVRAARPLLDERKASFQYEPPATPIWVTADAGATEQLVLNLLLNAAESLEPKARAGLAVEVVKEGATVRVWDEGRGIAPEDIERIFEPFYSTKEEGTGLGLGVAQRIARAHGSEIRVESKPGEGTCFCFTLPLGPEDETRGSVTNSSDAP